MSDLAADHDRLARYRRKLEAETDPVERADLEATIADLERKIAAQQHPMVDLSRSQMGDVSIGDMAGGALTKIERQTNQTIIGQAEVAVAGDVHGHIFINGRRGKSASELIAGYLRHLAGHCSRLPLQAMREQRAAGDVLAVSLDQVYTQLATTDTVEREHVAGQALKDFDAAAFLTRQRDDSLLPRNQRLAFIATFPDGYGDDIDDGLPPEDYPPSTVGSSQRARIFVGGMPVDMQRFSVADLQAYAREAEQLAFFGPQLVTEAIASNQRLVLLGEPGSGKSTALRYLAITLARAGLEPAFDPASSLEGWSALGERGRLLPIFQPLLPFAKRLASLQHPAGATELWNYLAGQLESEGRHQGLAAAVHDELESGNALLMLDGLDEVAGIESRRQVVRAVERFAHEYPQCRIIVSCRVRAYEGERNTGWQLPGWPTATLADWIPAQMRDFVDAWYKAAATATGMSDAKRDERTASLRRAISMRADLRRLGVRPLLMTIMALVHLNDQGQLPEGRVALYSRCVDLLLGQWELAREDGSAYGALMHYIELPDVDAKTLRPLLEQAAFQAHAASSANSPGLLGSGDLRVLVADFLEDRGHPNAHRGAKLFLEYTDVRAGLLQASDAGDAYTFPHLTFQEYLAGRALVSGVGVVQRIMQLRDDDRWRVPILLGVGDHVSDGKLEMPLALLSELIFLEGRAPAQQGRDLLLAAEIAADMGWSNLERGGAVFKKLRQDLADALASVVEGTALPAADRVRAGQYLGDLGDRRPGVCTFPPAMVEIAGGSFVIGVTEPEYQAIIAAEEKNNLADRAKDWYQDTVNHQPMSVAPFAIARYPVTNAQFKCFVDAENGYNPQASWWAIGGDWLRKAKQQQPQLWDDPRFGIARPNHPVIGVSWYEAMAFCAWLTQHLDDGFVYQLPSEAEWEFSARGSERRAYAWGNTEPDAEQANFNQRHDGTTAVGCFPAGATPGTGLLDMTGNVWEWTRSAYRPYPYDPDDGREDISDPARKRFTLRGGAWLGQPFNLRAAFRGSFSPVLRDRDVGFRLARHPKV